jgi:hypothetical protein
VSAWACGGARESGGRGSCRCRPGLVAELRKAAEEGAVVESAGLGKGETRLPCSLSVIPI